MLPDSTLLAYSQRGLFPGPEESEEQFLERLDTIDSFQMEEEPLSQEEWREAHAITKTLFDFKADWVKAFYMNRNLPFWQGAATWMEKVPFIQLKTSFRTTGRFSLYRREEILAHEAVHAARISFHEPRFEEHFAYLTSKKSFRRLFGPLFRHSWESGFLLSLFVLSLGAQASLLYWPDASWLQLFFLLPWAALLFALLRLAQDRRILHRCKEKFEKLFPGTNAWPILVRLTDKEIARFANYQLDEIQNYFKLEKSKSLRGRLLALMLHLT